MSDQQPTLRPMRREFLEQASKALLVEPNEVALFEAAVAAANSHRYGCNCDLCLFWWVMMGPDEDTGKHGPFANVEIVLAKKEMYGDDPV